MERSRVDLSIIIVSWNVADLLTACLDSIAAAPITRIAPDGAEHGAGTLRAEIIIVDSASQDRTIDIVRQQYPWAHLMSQANNIGFTRGNNIGLAQARGRHLLLLNPDTIVHDYALDQLVAILDQRPEVGIAGPRVLNTDGTTQSTRRRFPTSLTALFESTWLQGYAPRRILNHYYVTDQPDDGVYEVDWVQGCALIARREVYQQIGGLDTGYVMFSEELDWCRRAKAAGWQVLYVGEAIITHHGGKSTEQAPAHMHIHFQQSKLRYFRLYHGRVTALALRTFLLFSYGTQLVLEAIKALLGSQRPMRRARMATYVHVIRALVAPARAAPG